MTIITRPLEDSDQSRWHELWQGYLTFYGATLAPEVRAATWARLLDDTVDLYGLVAVCDGVTVGLAHYNFQVTTWSLGPHCLLEDLFVDPAHRGRGAGGALIDAVIDAARAVGSARVYWNTDHNNVVARRLYDRYGQATGKRQYRLAQSYPEGSTTP